MSWYAILKLTWLELQSGLNLLTIDAPVLKLNDTFEVFFPWLLTTEISVQSITINSTQAAIQGNPPLPRLATKLQTEFPSFHLLSGLCSFYCRAGPCVEYSTEDHHRNFLKINGKDSCEADANLTAKNRKVPRLQTPRNFERRERGKWNRSRWRPKTFKKPFFFQWMLGEQKKPFPICKDFGIIPLKQQFEKSRCCKFKGCKFVMHAAAQQVAGAKAKSQKLSGDERCNLITWYLAPEISTN